MPEDGRRALQLYDRARDSLGASFPSRDNAGPRKVSRCLRETYLPKESLTRHNSQTEQQAALCSARENGLRAFSALTKVDLLVRR